MREGSVRTQLSKLSKSTLLQRGVWAFVPDDRTHDETDVEPVRVLAVRSLVGRVLVVTCRFANGLIMPVILGNIDLADLRKNQIFMTATLIISDAHHFCLARYFDPDYEASGPAAFAATTGIRTESIFPISYDISHLAIGEPAVVCGEIPAEPFERLSRSELMQLALE